MYERNLKLQSHIIDFSFKFYKTLKPFRLFASRQPQSVAAVCIYIVTSQLKTHVTLEDIVQKCNISVATIKHLYNKIKPFINDALISVFTESICNSVNITNIMTIDIVTKVSRCICELGISQSIKVIIATGILFVIIVKGMDVSAGVTIENVQKVCNVEQHEIIEASKKIIPYKKALINEFIF